MRTDMRKVLIERPRIGHSRCYHDIRTRQNSADFDDMPSCEGMRRPYNYDERKEFSDLLGPLRGYLYSCRGRLWDDVWSEISAQLSNNTVDSHLKSVHVPQFIETHVTLIDDRAYGLGSRRSYGLGYEVRGLYVHPVTRLVCEQKPKPEKRMKVTRVDGIAYIKGEDGVLRPCSGWRGQNTLISRKIIGFECEAAWVDGLWYWVVFDTVPLPAVTLSEGGGKRVLNFERCDFVTGKTVKSGRYRADKRQMNARDLRRHGLLNG